MADQKKQESEAKNQSSTATGDPGRTAGTAEGDRQTVESDLRDKERGDKEHDRQSHRK
jgi:hypothetical protein